MTRTTIAALGLFTFLIMPSAGCDSVENTVEEYTDPAEALAKRKLEREAKLSGLYAEYGGGDAANIGANTVDEMKDVTGTADATENSAGKTLVKDIFNTMKTAVVENDREQFVAYCLQLGNGERVVPVTEKAQAFFAKAETAEACRAVNSMARDIQELQAKVNAKSSEKPAQ